MMKVLGILAVAFAMTGCATLSGPAPGPATPANDPGKLAVLSAGDAGAILCSVLRSEAKPDEVLKARVAASAARTLLADPEPSLPALQAAFSQALPPKYVYVAAVLAQRVKVRLGDAEVIPADSVGMAVAVSFLDACSLSLA